MHSEYECSSHLKRMVSAMREPTLEEQMIDQAAAAARSGEGMAPAGIQPAPLPTQVGVGQVDASVRDANGEATVRHFVVLMVTTPAGTGTYFFDPQAARSVGASLQQAGSLTESGLIVAQ